MKVIKLMSVLILALNTSCEEPIETPSSNNSVENQLNYYLLQTSGEGIAFENLIGKYAIETPGDDSITFGGSFEKNGTKTTFYLILDGNDIFKNKTHHEIKRTTAVRYIVEKGGRLEAVWLPESGSVDLQVDESNIRAAFSIQMYRYEHDDEHFLLEGSAFVNYDWLCISTDEDGFVTSHEAQSSYCKNEIQKYKSR